MIQLPILRPTLKSRNTGAREWERRASSLQPLLLGHTALAHCGRAHTRPHTRSSLPRPLHGFLRVFTGDSKLSLQNAHDIHDPGCSRCLCVQRLTPTGTWGGRWSPCTRPFFLYLFSLRLLPVHPATFFALQQKQHQKSIVRSLLTFF